ncbi:MAG: hypothetical protein O3A85_02910 [Proteobacteria bacterium]|nr:hypothetical protein [Pseudomonadota bacterium]
MHDFITAPMRFQHMAFKAAASVMSQIVEMQLHLFKQQLALFDLMQASRRRDDSPVSSVNPKARKRKGGKVHSPCCGPDLKDHYGKRAQDVDVEHI